MRDSLRQRPRSIYPVHFSKRIAPAAATAASLGGDTQEPVLLRARIGYHYGATPTTTQGTTPVSKKRRLFQRKLGDGIGMYKGRDGRQINAIGVRIERNDRH